MTKNSSCNKLWRAVDEAAQPARNGMMRMICPVVAVGVLSWGSLQIYQMNAQMALVSYKVEENYKMIKPMWQDFLRGGGRVAER